PVDRSRERLQLVTEWARELRVAIALPRVAMDAVARVAGQVGVLPRRANFGNRARLRGRADKGGQTRRRAGGLDWHSRTRRLDIGRRGCDESRSPADRDQAEPPRDPS